MLSHLRSAPCTNAAVLGPADVDDTTLTSMVAALLGADPAAVSVESSTVEEFPYDLPAITTAGRYVVSGDALVGRRADAVRDVRQGRAVVGALADVRLRPGRDEGARRGVGAVADRGARLPLRPRRPAARRADDAPRAGGVRPRREVRVRLARDGSRRRAGVGRGAVRQGGLPPRPARRQSPGGRARHGRASTRSRWRTTRSDGSQTQVIPMLHDDGIWQHPLVAATFGDELRDRLRAAAAQVPAYLEEVLALPHTAAHGDACPNNLLTTTDSPDFTLIDYGFWLPMPVGADLSQLLIGDVQIGKAARRRPRRPRRRPRGGVRPGPPRRGLRHPRARRPPRPRPAHADDERPVRRPGRAPRPPAVARPRGPGRRPRRHRAFCLDRVATTAGSRRDASAPRHPTMRASAGFVTGASAPSSTSGSAQVSSRPG